MSQNVNQPSREAAKEPSRLWLILRWVQKTALNNWPMKLLSLVLALALWAGLITQDPSLTRERTFRDVQVSINNADILKRNGYIVTSDLDGLLQGVEVEVEVPQMQFADAQPSNYNIRVDLNRLEKRAGMQELVIQTTNTSTYGSVTRVDPPSVTVMVEEYVTHSYIPVNVVTIGEVPEGFYAVGVTRDPEWITVSGPRSLVEQVNRAEVVLNMSDLPAREGKWESSLAFTLVDAQGQPIVSDMLQVTRESVLRERIGTSVTLYTKRDIDLLTAKLYTGKPAEGYEVTDVYVTPSYVTVAGLKSVVDSVDLLQLGKLVSIGGATDTVTATVDLAKPLNLQWMSASKATVTVVIQPVRASVQFTDVPVTVTDVAQGWSVQMAQRSTVVRVTGEAAWVNSLTADDLRLTCSAAGLSAGTQEVTLQCTVSGGEGKNFDVEIEPQTMRITLTPPQE